jgi:hypothetical protein
VIERYTDYFEIYRSRRQEISDIVAASDGGGGAHDPETKHIGF